MTKVYVLDTGALLSTWTQKQTDSVFLTTPQIIEELDNRPSLTRAQTLESTQLLQIKSVDESFISKIEDAAKVSGDKIDLSYADKTILALALSEQELDTKPILVSSDFAVLNTAIHLNIQILDITGKMSESRIWISYCPACNNTEKDPGLNLECSICGTKMIRRTQKRKKISKSK